MCHLAPCNVSHKLHSDKGGWQASWKPLCNKHNDQMLASLLREGGESRVMKRLYNCLKRKKIYSQYDVGKRQLLKITLIAMHSKILYERQDSHSWYSIQILKRLTIYHLGHCMSIEILPGWWDDKIWHQLKCLFNPNHKQNATCDALANKEHYFIWLPNMLII